MLIFNIIGTLSILYVLWDNKRLPRILRAKLTNKKKLISKLKKDFSKVDEPSIIAFYNEGRQKDFKLIPKYIARIKEVYGECPLELKTEGCYDYGDRDGLVIIVMTQIEDVDELMKVDDKFMDLELRQSTSDILVMSYTLE